MRSLFASASVLAAAIALATLPMPRTAQAGTGVIRCELPDGTRMYTNKACSSFGGKASPMSADVLTRIRADQRREVRMRAEREGLDAEAALAELDADRMVASAVPARRPVAGGCAGSPRQLARDLQASMAMGDVNRIAESFDGAGMGNTQAQRIMGQLERMAGRQLVDADYFDAAIASAGDAVDLDGGLMQVTYAGAGAASSVDDFEVTRSQGCYFLRYA
jgi:hypothetical protein